MKHCLLPFKHHTPTVTSVLSQLTVVSHVMYTVDTRGPLLLNLSPWMVGEMMVGPVWVLLTISVKTPGLIRLIIFATW